MVVAVPLMRMMQMAFHQIIGMATVRNGFVSAACAVRMFPVMRSTRMAWSTGRRIGASLRQSVLIHMSSMGTVKVPIVQIVNVPFMFDRGVSAAGSMRM